MSDLDILCTSWAWRGTPWDYNSLFSLRFRKDGLGEAVYGYGQTIYAIIRFQFDVQKPGKFRLTYLESPPGQASKGGFEPSPGNDSREINYRLTEVETKGVEPNAGPFRYGWTLALDASPFPAELRFPFDPPLEYYGHQREGVGHLTTTRGQP